MRSGNILYTVRNLGGQAVHRGVRGRFPLPGHFGRPTTRPPTLCPQPPPPTDTPIQPEPLATHQPPPIATTTPAHHYTLVPTVSHYDDDVDDNYTSGVGEKV